MVKHYDHTQLVGGVCWLSAHMTCAICNYSWVAVYPCCAPALECGECGYMNHRPDELGDA